MHGFQRLSNVQKSSIFRTGDLDRYRGAVAFLAYTDRPVTGIFGVWHETETTVVICTSGKPGVGGMPRTEHGDRGTGHGFSGIEDGGDLHHVEVGTGVLRQDDAMSVRVSPPGYECCQRNRVREELSLIVETFAL